MRLLRVLETAISLSLLGLSAAGIEPREFNVRNFGAKGDGLSVDSPAINTAIAAAASAGGGTVHLPTGRYLSFSIRLQSRVTLQLDAGAVLVAADPAMTPGGYDAPEPNPWEKYQDFGHSHWHNSLIWGEGLEEVAIVGPGLIDGTRGLTRAGPGSRRSIGAMDRGENVDPALAAVPAGAANKAIALKNCRGVVLRGFSVLRGGHFAVLATGVSRLTIENLAVDTNRDGLDIDTCREVRIENCTVNSPNDDAIVLKASFALGVPRATENVVIKGCRVSGFDVGTVFNGSRQRTLNRAPDGDGPTGRIKIGTESNGCFRNIVITDCAFERSRGLALETVDGGIIEDVTVRNLTMREIVSTPIFLRLGNRARGPEGTPVGAMRRIDLSEITVEDADARYAGILIAGLPGHPIEDVALSGIRIGARGGLSRSIVAQQPAELIAPFFLRGTEAGLLGPRDPLAVPEREAAYPEPSMFGLLPGSAVYARHVKGVTLRNVAFSEAQPDTRSRVVIDDAASVTFAGFRVPHPTERPVFVLRHVRDFSLRDAPEFADVRGKSAEDWSF